MRIIYTLFFLFTTICTFAQEATKTHHEETDFFEEEKMVSAYDYVFQTFEETKDLWKLDVSGIVLIPPFFSGWFAQFNNKLGLAYERKVGKAFSVNTSFEAEALHTKSTTNHRSLSRAFLPKKLRLSFEIQPRWYFQMKKRIVAGTSANNLSGNYIGLGWSFDNVRISTANVNNINREYIQTLGLKYGMQRRIFGRGFIDLQIGSEFILSNDFYRNENLGSYKRKYWRMASQVKLGFVFGKSELGATAGQRCDVFQCFEERKGMFKIDVLNALNLISNIGVSKYVSGTINFGYEFKVAPAWSINSEINLSYFHGDYTYSLYDPYFVTRPITMKISLQGRYYYDMKKRIASGKSSNNLNGNYFGLQMKTSEILPYGKTEFNLIFSPLWGLQRTIFKNGFIDYSFGLNLFFIDPGNNHVTDYTLFGQKNFEHRSVKMNSQLRIGFRF